MKKLTATLLAFGTTLALMAPAHADDMDKDSKGMDGTMMHDDMKDDGMAMDSMRRSRRRETLHAQRVRGGPVPQGTSTRPE